MRILTPSGYKEIADCAVGDEVCAFDLATGAPIINRIESVELVDEQEWRRWWGEQEPPSFRFYRINGRWTLNSEQSIWRNATSVCHVRDLVVGDLLYDDADHEIAIASIEEVAAESWWRFDISGDHSYIVDGLTLHNASRFWVGGAGTWDSSTTTHWASSTGGAGGASAPGSADTATLDGSSGGGTVTVNWASGTVTIQSITCGAHTGTLDFSANNNNVTLSGSAGLNGSGSATRTLNLGNGVWTITTTASGTVWNFTTTTGLTFNANSSTVKFAANTVQQRTLQLGGRTYNTIYLDANSLGGNFLLQGASTSSTLTIVGPNYVVLPQANTTTATTLGFNGSCGAAIGLISSTINSRASLSVASGTQNMAWCALKDINCTGGATFNAFNSYDLGNNAGVTITPPNINRAQRWAA